MRITKIISRGRLARRATPVGAAAIVLLASTAVTAAPTTRASENDLLKAEDALFAADMNHDVGAIEQGFADEAVFVHANGMRQTKAEYIAAARDANFRVRDVKGLDRVVRISGDIGVIRGTKTLTIGDGMHLSGTYLSVYIRRDGRWQLLDEQSSPEPRPARP